MDWDAIKAAIENIFAALAEWFVLDAQPAGHMFNALGEFVKGMFDTIILAIVG